MRDLTLENIIRVCGGRYEGPAELLGREISSVTTDSRAVEKGALFAAIAGERVDGHDFIGKAFSAGALCALAGRMPEGCTGGAVILVDDVVEAMQSLAAFYRSRFDIPVIGISGSVGKTTAKEMTASVLSRHFKVHRTSGNFNNDIGVPLTVFGLRDEHTAAVIEMGVSHFGDMERLARIVRPSCCMITVIGHAHIEFFRSLEGVLLEKTKMLDYMDENGVFFANGDDELLRNFVCRQRKICFGLGENCEVRAENVCAGEDGSTLCTVSAPGRRIPVRIRAYGDHMVYAALEAAAVGMELGLSDEEICQGIEDYEPVGSRSRVIDTGFIKLIDDCYNANPTSMAAAIRSMARLPGRQVCILGDMFELGEKGPVLHRQMGELAKEQGAALVLCCGELSENIRIGAGDIALHFSDKNELISRLPELIKRGDLVLVKASHSMGFDEVCRRLQELGKE